uniref:Enoyl reductase (ER) domain-containing protein n=1 Tax=Mycena chlorophos TaxID=658473 RepID=A0ABQ0M2A1_MYCCL|nr:predicted protein [Mycena chlorophos]
MATHTAIATTAKGHFEAIQMPTQTMPPAGSVLIEVAYASMVAFDTYITDLGLGITEYPVVLGLNVAGTVKAVGAGEKRLQVGDQITGFSIYSGGSKDGLQGTLQEYLVLPSYLCATIPATLSLPEAATIPDNFITSFYTLFDQLSLPIPSTFPASTPPSNPDVPILIYGAGATNGQYAIQLLHLAGYTNILATASPRHHALLRSLGAAHVFDYRSPTLTADVKAIASNGVELALDAVTADSTIARIAPLMAPTGSIALLLPIKVGDAVAVGDAGMRWELPAEVNPLAAETKINYVRTFLFDKNEYLKEHLMPQILPQLLRDGLIQPNKVRLLDQGTLKERVGAGLELLRSNAISGEKIIVKVSQ